MIGCNPALSNQGYSNPSASDALIELSKWRVRQGLGLLVAVKRPCLLSRIYSGTACIQQCKRLLLPETNFSTNFSTTTS